MQLSCFSKASIQALTYFRWLAHLILSTVPYCKNCRTHFAEQEIRALLYVYWLHSHLWSFPCVPGTSFVVSKRDTVGSLVSPRIVWSYTMTCQIPCSFSQSFSVGRDRAFSRSPRCGNIPGPWSPHWVWHNSEH